MVKSEFVCATKVGVLGIDIALPIIPAQAVPVLLVAPAVVITVGSMSTGRMKRKQSLSGRAIPMKRARSNASMRNSMKS